MPKTASAGMKTQIALQHTRFTGCMLVIRRDGDVQGFTEFDEPLLIDLGDGNGLITYRAVPGYDRSAIKSTNTFAADNLNVKGFLDLLFFPRDDILAGKYGYAEVKVFFVNWDNLSNGIVRMRRGYFRDITVLESSFEAQLHGLLSRYSEGIVGSFTPNCRADFGDQPGFSPSIHGCKVRYDPPVWAPEEDYTVRPARDASLGSVIKPTSFIDRHLKCVTAGTSGTTEPSWNLTIGGQTTDGSVVWETEQALTIPTGVGDVTDNLHFTVTYSGDASAELLKDGLVKFITGPNAGENVEIETWNPGTGLITLSLPVSRGVYPITGADDTGLLLEDGSGVLLLEDDFRLLLETGDLVELIAGCAKTQAACQGHDNMDNPRAEWHVPGAKVVLRTPDAQ